jgi:glycosyltransferase involved in cell wall biosynthesis
LIALNFNWETIGIVLLCIFGTTIFIQLVYYVFVYGRIFSFPKNKKIEKSADQQVPVSVIICARNEAENLEINLPSILEQDYSNYEVIVVNDCSFDETEQVLLRMKAQYPHLRTTFIKEDSKFSHGKKLALTIGIKAAQNEWLLFTDADCCPQSQDWISCMASNFTESAGVVLGYGGFNSKKGLLNRLIRYDGMIIALQYFCFAKLGNPYMGVGRNLAYRKSLFFQNRGFASHLHIESGDDDLFVKEVANKKNTKLEMSIPSHTRTIPKTTYKSWKLQKSRHFTTSKYYKTGSKMALGLEPLSRILMYLTFIGLLFFKPFLLPVVIALFVREIMFLSVIISASHKFNEKGIAIHAFWLDLIMPIISLTFLISSIFAPRRQWR